VHVPIIMGDVPAADHHLFVSYSHRADYRLTRRIETFLETFHKRVPKRSRQQLSPLNVCVDGNDFKLPPSPASSAAARDVPQVIVENLARSRELLVVCSAAAAQSKWIDQEIDWFLTHRGPQSIRLALSEGDQPMNEPERYFAPGLLAHGLHRNICYDLRGFDARRAREWSAVADYERELVRLASDINGLAAGDVYPLWLEEERRRTRRVALSATVAACLILAGVGYGVVERSGRQVADANRRAAEAQAVAAQADARQKESDRQAEEERRKAADANARAQQALRLVSDAFERLYRAPSEALRLARESSEVQPSEMSARALEDAYRVAIYRKENRRQARRLTGSGPGYLASRWSQSNLSAVVSADGRYVVVITPRGRDGVTGPDGKPMPGELYLIDNETQRPVQLVNCRTNDINRRVEYVGFDAAVRQVVVTRHYNLMVYSLSGDCLGTVLLECCTKSPIQLVEGYFAERYLIAADTKGGLWLAELATRQVIQVRREFAGDTVAAIELSADGSRAVVISESGRATLLTLNAAGRPNEVDIARGGVLAAAFDPQDGSRLAVAGDHGLVQIWSVEAGKPVAGERFSVPRVPVDSITFSGDGRGLIAIADDLRLFVLQRGVPEPVATLDKPIAWEESRSVANHFAEHRPESFDPVAETGDRVPFPHPTLAVGRVEVVDGRTWLRSVRKPEDFFPVGAAYLVDGSGAWAVPDRESDVSRVHGLAGSTWLETSTGLYQVTSRGVRLALPPKATVLMSVQIGPSLWFGTSQGAWRVQGDSIARFTPTDLAVTDIRDIDGSVWFTSRTGVFRLDARNRLLRVTDEGTPARQVVKIRNRLWIMTGTESEPGPALLVHDLWTRTLPSRASRVSSVVDAGGQTWLLSDRGLFRMDGETPTAITGIEAVADVKDVGGRVIALQRALFGGGPAFLIKGDRATRLIPNAGVSQIVTIDGAVYMTTLLPDGFSARAGPLYRLRGEVAELVGDAEARVTSIYALGGRTWLQIESGNGAQPRRLENDRIVALPPEEEGFAPLRIATVEGTEWWLGVGRACAMSAERRRCFHTPGRKVTGVRRVHGSWWLLTEQGIYEPGPAYRVDGDTAKATPDDTLSVSDVVDISGATWLVTRRNGKPAPLQRVN
jgi:hypothetical protein